MADPGYDEMPMPPQEQRTSFVCRLCSAVVMDPRRHTLAVHPEGAQVTPADRAGDPRQSAGKL